ncbi:DUF1778 domain-containing protein [Stenotrophomonas sp. PS02300]|uniref:type II toxin-antitoxin system TacA family antitoxin n=1 Tax=Stenotrophomonas sp. PS02300 TaxID=2991426 RepID=UPI00249C0A29|nr:DUF1778 domain-containing protein [Stenotrophomonas sp. PS02300]
MYAQFSKVRVLPMGTASKVINFRAPADKQDLIDRAVAISGVNRTEFILDAACDRAREVLAEQTQFTLNAGQLQRFNALLDAPLDENLALRRLLSTPAPWER